MSLLDLLLGRWPDPTKNWQKKEAQAPEIDLDQCTIEPLSFGCAIEAAQCFGKPDRFTSDSKELCQLLYARAGFLVDFGRDGLEYIAFLIGKDRCIPNHPALAFSNATIRGHAPLSAETTVADIEKLMGDPTTEDSNSEETVLMYHRNNITIEFEFNTKQHLKRLNLFPEAS